MVKYPQFITQWYAMFRFSASWGISFSQKPKEVFFRWSRNSRLSIYLICWSTDSYYDGWQYSELQKHLHLRQLSQAEMHHDFPKTLPGQGTEHGNCSTLSFDGSSPHNVFSTGLDVAETDASCATHVRLRTCNPSPHCPPYKVIEGNGDTYCWC